MSDKNILEDKKKLGKINIFLGKKLENIEKCKLCNKSDALIKCIKCLNYYCKDCLSNIFGKSLNEIKSDEYTCSVCQKNKENNITPNKCFICNKLIKDTNFTYFNVNKEQAIKLKNEINELNSNIIINLSEEEEKNEDINIKQKDVIKICNECNSNYDDLIAKCFLLKKEKEEKKQKNIIEELTEIIMKENGYVNIFDILENKIEKSEDSSNENKSNIKKKPKDLFESMVVERKDNNTERKKDEKDNKKNILIRDEKFKIENIKKFNQKIPSININSNNKTSNIYLPNFFTITHLQNNTVPNNQNNNQKIPNNTINQNIFSIPNYLSNINPQNNLFSKDNINQNKNEARSNNDIQNKISNLIQNNINNNISNLNMNKNKILENNKNTIQYFQQNNLLNIDNRNNKVNNCSDNLKDIKEGINNLINLNNPNKNNINNISLNQNVNSIIKGTLEKISKCMYNFDNNNLENNINILNKIELLANVFSKLIKDHNNNIQKKEETNIEKNEKINIEKSDEEVINSIISLTELLKNQIKILKTYSEIKKIFLSIIYQNIDIYLKEMNRVQNNNSNTNNNTNQTSIQNLNNIFPQLIPINSFNSLAGINLLNSLPGLDISSLSNNLNNPISQLLSNNNILNCLPIFNFPINIPNFSN